MEIYLIRHTTPQIVKGICYGQSEVPLADTFASEAEELLKKLPSAIDAVYSSPLTRCYRLAKQIPAKKLVKDTRLLEMNFGDWEMRRWDEIDQITLDAWMKKFVTMRVPGGENFVDVNNRVTEFVSELVTQDYKKVVLVTHGGVIKCISANVRGIVFKEAFNIAVPYSSVIKINITKDNNFWVNQV
jgi:alpha-ribazole phosphatase